MSAWHDIGTAEDFNEDEPVAVIAGGQPVAVFRLGEELFALRDLCTHGNARLSDGYIEDGCIECPLHQGMFDIKSGAPRCAPVTEAVRSFPVRVVAGRVEVEVSATPQLPHEAAIRHVQMVVETVQRAASDVAVIRLRAEDAATPALDYIAGQYVDVLLADGQRRSYSMATPAGGGLELHVRHMPGGLFSDQVFASLRAGDTLKLEGPCGSFFLRDGDHPVILLASGTGFAPIKALLEDAISNGSTRSMCLYWGGRRQPDLYMDALCRGWAESLPWFRYVPVLSEPEPHGGWQGRTGFVHLAVMEDHADLSQHQVYACGAPVVVEAARRDFSASCSLPATHFFADAFLSKADSRP
ncbi:2-polyprenylphenol hydroxylase and related flavodoxin oxidoreductases / CDP-6-deoxy-delta-3,4-glucoseen reductase-like [Collimonas arenae]|uniref:2-polyprenylphenol hydroxylase and related flavodoxin oxidoreductases / CDP-6-deoxy-delta-3,4-glucoseen reductase-like n=1 Tax=Collimonas arenae TaxID=279058 RepID=A0A0A1F695_9BURK|nr:anthranilate 1,2-dioxygenase ferredoxin subunit AndAb [Collimonas arenae]AIY39300.1 2-polyprenylphenol hydroxylase and related flavodoxin oxidoreductases / CDP-6-deoxy-delta-3,4-glucoseen reductase-like [Collimonas arenae]